MDRENPENPYTIQNKLQMLSEKTVKEPPQGLMGVVISLFDINFTDEQRYYIWWWLFDGEGEPSRMHTKDLSSAQKQALIDWVKPERFEMPERVAWLAQPHFYKELNLIWFEVWKILIRFGIIVDEKIYMEV